MRKHDAFTGVCRSATAEDERKPVPIGEEPVFLWPGMLCRGRQ
ncbi:hypothetical protein [Bacillus haynesii]|nr:hypothetical protein [Bacillus haynesii]MEC0672803.1 hypothetical protein [Bacillus haynesii]